MQEKIAMVCPVCHGRVFDTSTLPNVFVEISTKCPNCGRIVSVPLTPQAVKRSPPSKAVLRKLATCKKETYKLVSNGSR